MTVKPRPEGMEFAVEACLRREGVPAGAIRAEVVRGRVILKGEVDLFHQRDALERAVMEIPGVEIVVNLIGVRPPESQADIPSKVRSAVMRDIRRLDPERAPRSEADDKGATMNQGATILIIDDDDDFRASVRPVLEAAGYIVCEGRSGREGLAQLTAHDPDAIMLDIMMETGEDGYGVNQAIKFQDEYQKYRRTPIIMVSSISETPEERFPRASELEMIQPDAYLTKPLDMDRMLAVVRRALERRRHT